MNSTATSELATTRSNLLFDTRHVGRVEQLDFDFPRAFGTYEIVLPEDTDATNQLIHAYIRYSVEACRLMETDDSDGSEWDRYQSEHEIKYIDLIESDDWWLDYGNRKVNIMVPNFCTGNEIVWVLN
ncbi:MAG: hypothetical protein AAFU85_20970 [Planctomycetota bacterium]